MVIARETIVALRRVDMSALELRGRSKSILLAADMVNGYYDAWRSDARFIAPDTRRR